MRGNKGVGHRVVAVLAAAGILLSLGVVSGVASGMEPADPTTEVYTDGTTVDASGLAGQSDATGETSAIDENDVAGESDVTNQSESTDNSTTGNQEQNTQPDQSTQNGESDTTTDDGAGNDDSEGDENTSDNSGDAAENNIDGDEQSDATDANDNDSVAESASESTHNQYPTVPCKEGALTNGKVDFSKCTVEGVTPSNSTINLFDYWTNANNPLEEGTNRYDDVINANHALKFLKDAWSRNYSSSNPGGKVQDRGNANFWTGPRCPKDDGTSGTCPAQGVDPELDLRRTGIVQNTLENGYPKLAGNTSTNPDMFKQKYNNDEKVQYDR